MQFPSDGKIGLLSTGGTRISVWQGQERDDPGLPRLTRERLSPGKEAAFEEEWATVRQYAQVEIETCPG